MFLQKIEEKFQNFKSEHFHWLLLGLTFLHLLPIWLFKYVPTQDGPCHIENSFMLLHYNDEGRTFSRYYEINDDPVPNWMSHIIMAGMMVIFPPLISEKILLSGYIILFVLGFYYLLNAIDSRKTFYTLLAFPFIYNYLFHMGFYNFSLSIPLASVAIGFWWRRRDRFDWKTIVGLNLLLILLHFAHLVSLMIALMTLFILAVSHHRLKLHKVLFLGLALIPSYILPIYFVQSRGTAHSGIWEFKRLWDYFICIGSLTSYSPKEDYIGKALALIFALLVIYTLFWEKFDLKNRRFRFNLKTYDGFFIAMLCCFVLYIRMPDGMSGGGFITTRLNLYPFLVIIPWLSPDFIKKPIKYAIGGIIIIVMLAHLAYTTYYYKVLNDSLREYTSGIPFVKKNETILPLSFNNHGKSYRIGLYLHSAGYYCAAKGTIELDNYEGNTGYFPMTYREEMNPFRTIGNIEGDPGNTNPLNYPEPIDNILIWSLNGEVPMLNQIKPYYSLIHQQGRLKLFKRNAK